MFKKVLIANRGEIALRVIWACKELGLKTVAVYSEADRNSLHVKFADQAICIGPARSKDSYLSVPAIISAAEITGADAIHPGYGFLAESSYFAEVCEACRITFIGPSPQAIRLMGDKSRAKKAMIKAGVPVVPGSPGILENEEQAIGVAKDIGYPVIVKASAGGGGRGMRIVRDAKDLVAAFRAAQAEATAAFGVPDLYIEKFIEQPRHIEIQVMADQRGNVVSLHERECSIQRRHQKLIEEAPSPAALMNEKLRRRMGKTATDAAAAVNYSNAGTIEFLLDAQGNYYFMEMNTRIQVEHGVTELVTGRDLVKEQILVAAEQPLSFRQADVGLVGHALECRINAEDPRTFAPSPGLIKHFWVPGGPGIRVDTFAHEGCEVSPYYDSMVAKLMTFGKDRTEAIARMRRALDTMVVEGIKTSIPLQRQIMDDPDFISGKLDTGFMERFLKRTAPI
ncbi:MAG: acetyl-CoA carboxylase biotin carboxylase subunit [Vicinamibacteria bacterium]|jgi:acetyl-CoA carboxylase biotin carboxylase subunit|nr:acetyl-CoA carboxylase biotin carboxylase subunit [Vicinamibacteria bacterium]